MTKTTIPANLARWLENERRSGPILTVADQAIVAGTNFAILVVFGRYLPGETFGTYVVALALLNLTLGIHGALVTFPLTIHGTAEHSEETLTYIRGSGRLHLIQIAIAATLALLVGSLMPATSLWRGILLTYGALQIPYQLNDYIRRLLLTRHKIVGLLRHDVIGSAGKVAGIVLFVRPERATLPDICLALCTGLLLAVASHYALDGFRLWRSPRNAPPPSALATAQRNWALTRLMLPEVLAYHATTQVFVLMSASLLLPLEVAALGGMQAIANVINVVLVGLTNYGLVDMSRARHRSDPESWRSAAVVMAAGALAMAFLCSAALLTAPEFLIARIYGPSTYMLQYSGVLRIFGVVIVARTSSVVLITVLRSVELQGGITKASLVSGAVAVTIAAPLMIELGLPGAAYGLLAGQCILSIGLLLAARKGLRQGGAGRALLTGLAGPRPTE